MQDRPRSGFLQAVAQWLVARPQNAVLALFGTLLLPLSQLISGAVLVMLVLGKGARSAALAALLASGLLVLVETLVGQGGMLQVLVLVAATYLPALLLTGLLMRLGSLTLTVQLTVILALMGYLVFRVAVVDEVAFWQPYLDMMEELVRQNGLQLDTQLLTAEIMTVSAVLVLWTQHSAALLCGYALYRRLPGETRHLGWFRDLDFGRVIAGALAILSLLMFVVGSGVFQDIAFILFAIFMLQGLAIVHWLRAKEMLPSMAVVSMYLLLPFLQILLVMVLALVGYTDAWLRFRGRIEKSKGSKL